MFRNAELSCIDIVESRPFEACSKVIDSLLVACVND